MGFFFFFFNTGRRIGFLHSRERPVASSEAQTGHEARNKKDVGLHFKQLLSSVPCVWFTGEAEKKKKLITPTDGCPIQRKCQKDSHDSQSTCEKEHSTGNTTDLQMVICAGR